MTLLHGSNLVIIDIDLTKSRRRTDFGLGFYLINKLGDAREWATRKASFYGGLPTVTRYELNNAILREAKHLRFDDATLDWLYFVKQNRERKNTQNSHLPEPRHDYDSVSGPIADDKVADVVDRFCAGEVTAETALSEIRVIPNVFQFSLHTATALKFVKTIDYQQCKNGKWTDWIET